MTNGTLLPSLTSRGQRILRENSSEPIRFHVSRYATEYEEMSFIAKGGFGTVFKAKNKLDGCEYAIKKMVLNFGGDHHEEIVAKILREVTTLANLSHANVVSYKTAWMEPLLNEDGHCVNNCQADCSSGKHETESSTTTNIKTNEFEEENSRSTSFEVCFQADYSNRVIKKEVKEKITKDELKGN